MRLCWRRCWPSHPDNDLIPKLVRGLLDGRREGRWASTQDSAWILLAMDAYFAAFESEEPDFSARAWLGSQFAGEAEPSPGAARTVAGSTCPSTTCPRARATSC